MIKTAIVSVLRYKRMKYVSPLRYINSSGFRTFAFWYLIAIAVIVVFGLVHSTYLSYPSKRQAFVRWFWHVTNQNEVDKAVAATTQPPVGNDNEILKIKHVRHT